jgi:general secretion pathway protein D
VLADVFDEQRYADAQILAKRATELDPENPVVVQLNVMSRMASRMAQNDQIKSDQEANFDDVMRRVEGDAVPFEGPIQMPDAKKWATLSKTRLGRLRDGTQRRSPKELEIAQRLNTPVDAKYQNRPLREVLDGLAKRASVPLYIDPQGLQSEGVSSDAKVTIDLTQDISLKSALNLILEQFHLTYVIKDEVLKITSEDAKKGEVYQLIYPVGDLVIPIPNFAPSGREGINGAFREAYERMGFSGAAGADPPGAGGLPPVGFLRGDSLVLRDARLAERRDVAFRVERLRVRRPRAQ